MNFYRDLAVYVAIAALSAAQTFVANGQLPQAWAVPIGVLLAVAIALKAKLSGGENEARYDQSANNPESTPDDKP